MLQLSSSLQNLSTGTVSLFKNPVAVALHRHIGFKSKCSAFGFAWFIWVFIYCVLTKFFLASISPKYLLSWHSVAGVGSSGATQGRDLCQHPHLPTSRSDQQSQVGDGNGDRTSLGPSQGGKGGVSKGYEWGCVQLHQSSGRMQHEGWSWNVVLKARDEFSHSSSWLYHCFPSSGLLHSSQTTGHGREDMAEPAPAIRAPNVSC